MLCHVTQITRGDRQQVNPVDGILQVLRDDLTCRVTQGAHGAEMPVRARRHQDEIVAVRYDEITVSPAPDALERVDVELDRQHADDPRAVLYRGGIEIALFARGRPVNLET